MRVVSRGVCWRCECDVNYPINYPGRSMHVVGWLYGLVAKPTRAGVELYRRPALLQQRRGSNRPPRSPTTRACVLAGAGSLQGHLPRWAIRARNIHFIHRVYNTGKMLM